MSSDIREDKKTKNEPPQELGSLAQFEVVRRLGEGGMAEVFLARKKGAEGTYKLLVVKRILPTHGSSRRFRTMFVEEAQLATRLNHPNVVQVYELSDGGDEGQLLVMEYVEGPDLGMLMSAAKAKGTRLPPWIGAWIIGEAAKGLHYAHSKKDESGTPLEIVHRDVSPQNILLSYDGAVKITDFGIASAKLFVEETGVLKGKFGYMSPEQARGERVDRRSDVYSLGVILWEILAGRPLHAGLGGEALLDIVRSGIVEPPSTYARDVPTELESIVMSCLAPHREQRFPSGRELTSAIARALLVRQELVDASLLEAIIAELVGRDGTKRTSSSPPSSRGSDAPIKHASLAMRLKRQSSPPPSVHGDAPVSEQSEPVPESVDRKPPPGPREVRHVAIVTLRLHGVRELVEKDEALGERALDRLRAMLEEIAYKRGMRCWIWSSDTEARAVAGLTANTARAAADAAWLALDTHESIAGLSDDLPTAVGASIGIVRGIASGFRDGQGNLVRYRLHDPATHLADVISQATPLQTTWVAGGVYRLVRREFKWGDAPTLELTSTPGVENVPPTMRIYTLQRSLSRDERVATMGNVPSDLVGRDVEKNDLHAAFHHAVSGYGALTCRAVVGEMGIGKSAVVAAFTAELPPNARIVKVECTPVKVEVPFSAVAEAVRECIGTTGDEPFDDVVTLIARAGGGSASGDASNPVVARLAELATNVPLARGDEEDPSYRRRLIAAGLRSLFAAIALAQPLVFIVEGLQWADKQSLEVFGEITKTADPLPILVLLVSRPAEHCAALLEGVVRVELQGLSAEEQVRLIENRLGVRDGVRPVCADLLPKVGGNPFFLLEVIDALLERGALEIREERDESGEPRFALVRRSESDSWHLPSTLEQLLGDRLRELPLEEHTMVDWLAIAGGPLAVAHVLELSRMTSEDALVRLCARGLCDRKGDQVDFRHPLTRDVAYKALEPRDRTAMHRGLGLYLGQTSLGRGLSAAIVARHLQLGGEPSLAVDFYLEAAQAARTGSQYKLAARYFKRIVSLLEPNDERSVAAHEALEGILRVLGRRRERIHHLEALRKAARLAGTSRALGLALSRTARFDLDEGRLSHGLPFAKQAADLARRVGSAALEVEAEALISELLRELGDVPGALAACDRALVACGSEDAPQVPPRARAEVLRSRGVLLRRVGRVREAVDAYVDAIAVFRRVGARRQEARAKHTLAFAMYCQGHYEDAIGLALESIQIDIGIGGRFQLANTLTNIGAAYARLGDFARAKAYLERARNAHERYGDQDGRADTLIVSAEVLLECGEIDAATGFLADAAALNAATDNAYDRVHESIARAALELARGKAAHAAEIALTTRRVAENLALVSFQFYGLALEASARATAGELHNATLLATTALGAVETLQGSEYGLDVRVLCTKALTMAGSPEAPLARRRATAHAAALMQTIRDPRLRVLFAKRPFVQVLLSPGGGSPSENARA
jgi:serine/threonine protein kinase/tetratricopeptide (TPR) repeat protein